MVNKGVRVEPTRSTIQATFKGDPEVPGLCSAIIFLLINHCLRFAFWFPLRPVTPPTRRLRRGTCLGNNGSSGTESAPVPAWPHEGPPGHSFKQERFMSSYPYSEPWLEYITKFCKNVNFVRFLLEKVVFTNQSNKKAWPFLVFWLLGADLLQTYFGEGISVILLKKR